MFLNFLFIALRYLRTVYITLSSFHKTLRKDFEKYGRKHKKTTL